MPYHRLFFTGPKIVLSSGWGKSVVCGGRQNISTLLLFASFFQRKVRFVAAGR